MKKDIDVNGIMILHKQGRSQRWIAKHYLITRHLVKRVISGRQEIERKIRTDKITIPEDELVAVYEKCDRWAERTHEILTKRGYLISYSTLTKRLRELSDYNSVQKLSQRYEVKPGEEFQHDTSPIWVKLGDKKIKLQASSLIFRFSRQRYLKFYRSFTRFEMQCFFHEALMFYGYSAKQCVIDNTNLAVLKGSGREAIFVPEMELFAKSYSFEWKAHEIKHSDRKATVESSFKTVNCNFLPGRDFTGLDDLNNQALEWATGRSQKPVAKINQTPEVLFALEKSHLTQLPLYLTAPYKVHSRKSDQYGFLSFRANFYYVGIKYCLIELLEFSNTVKIYRGNKLLWSYDMARWDLKGQQIRPAMLSSSIKTIARDSKTNKALALKFGDEDPRLDQFLKQSLVMVPTQRLRNTLVRHLEKLYTIVPKKIFFNALEKASTHDIFDKSSIDRLITIELQISNLPPVSLTSKPTKLSATAHLEKRKIFQQFKETPTPNLDKYTDNNKKDVDDEN